MGGHRVRKLLAVVGGSAVTVTAALTILTSPAPEHPIDVCAILPSWQGCRPPVPKDAPTRDLTAPTYTQKRASPGG